MNEVQQNRIVPGTSEFTLRLRDILSEGKEGDILTDEQLTEKAGVNTAVQQKGYNYLLSAIKWTEKNKGIVWKRIPGAGAIECLKDRGKAILVHKRNDHIRKAASRTVRIAATVNTEKLDPQEKEEFTSEYIRATAVKHVGSNTTLKKIQARHIMALPKPDDVLKMVEYLTDTCEIFKTHDDHFYSDRVLTNMEKRDAIKEKRSLAGKASAKKRAKMSTSDEQKPTHVEQKPTKEKKEKEKKEKIDWNKLLEYFNLSPKLSKTHWELDYEEISGVFVPATISMRYEDLRVGMRRVSSKKAVVNPPFFEQF